MCAMSREGAREVARIARPRRAQLVVYRREPHTFDMELPDRTLLGMRLGYDADATADARRRVIAFLTARGFATGRSAR